MESNTRLRLLWVFIPIFLLALFLFFAGAIYNSWQRSLTIKKALEQKLNSPDSPEQRPLQ